MFLRRHPHSERSAEMAKMLAARLRDRALTGKRDGTTTAPRPHAPSEAPVPETEASRRFMRTQARLLAVGIAAWAW